MCRFAVYMGEPLLMSTLTTQPEHSIIHQSFASREREEPLNGDGFGIAWYAPEITHQPALFKSIKPAWGNMNLQHLAPVIKSHCMLAHIRAASPGLPVTELNCHPFSWHDMSFMHNGNVGGFAKIKRGLLEKLSDESFHWIKGSTDSEHLFALFIEYFQSHDPSKFIDSTIDCLRLTINTIENLNTSFGITEASYLNLVVSNGQQSVITRYATGNRVQPNSLYYFGGRQIRCENNVCQVISGDDQSNQAVVVASEPLTKDSQWQKVEENHFLTIDKLLNVKQVSI